MSPLPTAWYSGYLDVTATKKLFYIFIESQDKPDTDPVILWLNGGPGCSSLFGLLEENGPFIIDDGETVVKPNPYPWNVRANTLYIDNPFGAGFSYTNNTDDLTHSDMEVSNDLFTAVHDFFRAFPERRNNAFWISGESYAGIFGPYLAWQIHQWNLEQKMHNWNDTINLKGFAMGNGYTAPYINQLNYDLYMYLNVISYDLWKSFKKAGCIWNYVLEDIPPVKNPPECDAYFAVIYETFFPINIYDLYRHNYNPMPNNTMQSNASSIVNGAAIDSKNLSLEQRQNFLRAMGAGRKYPHLKTIVGDAQEDYFNRPDVREALHIPPEIPHYYQCSNDIFNLWKS